MDWVFEVFCLPLIKSSTMPWKERRVWWNFPLSYLRRFIVIFCETSWKWRLRERGGRNWPQDGAKLRYERALKKSKNSVRSTYKQALKLSRKMALNLVKSSCKIKPKDGAFSKFPRIPHSAPKLFPNFFTNFKHH